MRPVAPKRSSRSSLSVARRLESYLASNFETPLPEFRRGVIALEADLLAAYVASGIQREIRRRCAEMYCGQCLERGASWNIAKKALSSLDALGYSNTHPRAHFAVLLGQYAASEPRARSAAKMRAADVLRRMRRLRRNSFRRHFETLLEPFA